MHFCYEFFLHGVEKYMSNKIFKIKRPFSMCSVYQKKNSQVTFNKTSFTFLVVSNSDKIPPSRSLVFSEKLWALLSHVICRKIELVASNIINTYFDFFFRFMSWEALNFSKIVLVKVKYRSLRFKKYIGVPDGRKLCLRYLNRAVYVGRVFSSWYDKIISGDHCDQYTWACLFRDARRPITSTFT